PTGRSSDLVAQWLENRDDVSSVNYPGLASSAYHDLARQYLHGGSTAVLTFELPGGLDAGRNFINALELHRHVANLGDVRSLAIHPASTTHSQLTAEQQAGAGVSPGMVRLAVGIEGIDDILADLETGLNAAK